jgi:hypothetical protein
MPLVSIDDVHTLARALFPDRGDVLIAARSEWAAVLDPSSGEVLISSLDATLPYSARIEDADSAMLALSKLLHTTIANRLRDAP